MVQSVLAGLRNITGSVQCTGLLYRIVRTLVMAPTGTDTIIVTGAPLPPPPPSYFQFNLYLRLRTRSVQSLCTQCNYNTPCVHVCACDESILNDGVEHCSERHQDKLFFADLFPVDHNGLNSSPVSQADPLQFVVIMWFSCSLDTEDCLNLSQILKVFSAPITEEHAWALVHQVGSVWLSCADNVCISQKTSLSSIYPMETEN